MSHLPLQTCAWLDHSRATAINTGASCPHPGGRKLVAYRGGSPPRRQPWQPSGQGQRHRDTEEAGIRAKPAAGAGRKQCLPAVWWSRRKEMGGWLDKRHGESHPEGQTQGRVK